MILLFHHNFFTWVNKTRWIRKTAHIVKCFFLECTNSCTRISRYKKGSVANGHKFSWSKILAKSWGAQGQRRDAQAPFFWGRTWQFRTKVAILWTILMRSQTTMTQLQFVVALDDQNGFNLPCGASEMLWPPRTINQKQKHFCYFCYGTKALSKLPILLRQCYSVRVLSDFMDGRAKACALWLTICETNGNRHVLFL